MFAELKTTVEGLDTSSITEERKQDLQELMDYIQQKVDALSDINLNFICTHNSRRSHLSQIWSQTMAYHFKVKNVSCYSGGTEATALFPMVAQTLRHQGFQTDVLCQGKNPIYAIKYADNQHPIIGFSKTYDDNFNPKHNFAAIMTCAHADENCPVINGGDKRIALRYKDPKAFDDTPQQEAKYLERSVQIATEMKYIFSKIKTI